MLKLIESIFFTATIHQWLPLLSSKENKEPSAMVRGTRNSFLDYLDYHYSSARFYETGVDKFGFLNNLFLE